MRLKSFISVGILLLSCGLAATGQEARRVIAKPAPIYPEIAKRMGAGLAMTLRAS